MDTLYLPPHAIRVSPKDLLRATLISKDAAYDLHIRALIMLDNGDTVPIADFIAATGSYTLDAKEISLHDGWLISASLRADVDPGPGGAYAILELARQETSVNLGQIALVHGYISTNRSISWPGVSPTSSIETGPFADYHLQANPAAGANFTITVPALNNWTLEGLAFTLTTDANVATRRVIFTMDFGSSASVFYRKACAVTQIASLAYDYNFYDGLAADALNVTTVEGPLPKITIPGGARIITVITSLQATDQISLIIAKLGRQIYS